MEEKAAEVAGNIFLSLPVWAQILLIAITAILIVVCGIIFLRFKLGGGSQEDLVGQYKEGFLFFKEESSETRKENRMISKKLGRVILENQALKNQISQLSDALDELSRENKALKHQLDIMSAESAKQTGEVQSMGLLIGELTEELKLFRKSVEVINV